MSKAPSNWMSPAQLFPNVFHVGHMCCNPRLRGEASTVQSLIVSLIFWHQYYQYFRYFKDFYYLVSIKSPRMISRMPLSKDQFGLQSAWISFSLELCPVALTLGSRKVNLCGNSQSYKKPWDIQGRVQSHQWKGSISKVAICYSSAYSSAS